MFQHITHVANTTPDFLVGVEGGNPVLVPRGLTLAGPSTSQDSTATERDALRVAAAALSSSGYVSALTTDLDQGFGTVTFSRSGANGSVLDCYGTLQFVKSGEPRRWGARRVQNTIDAPEDFSNASYWTAVATPTAAGIKSPNHGRPSSFRVARASGSTNILVLNSKVYRPGKWCFSAWILGDGVTQYTIRIERQSDSAGTSQLVTPPAGVLQRVYVTHDIPDKTNHRAFITVATAGAAALTALDPQMEWVHGQASPAPSDYVPNGVSTSFLPASAYASAGADGVRYYNYFNPWTGSSGVATRSQTLNYIDPATLRGTAVAGASTTNQMYSSGDLSAADWTKTATVNATPADSTLLGKNSLWKIEQTSATQQHYVQQVLKTVPATLSRPMYVEARGKLGDAACPFVYIAVRQTDASTIKYAYFNMATGVVSNVTSGAEGYIYLEGDCWVFGLVTSVGSSGSTAPRIWIGVTQTAGSDLVLGTAGNGSYVGAVQADEGLPTSYLGDTGTGASLTRNAEFLSAVSTRMPSDTWSLSADFTCRFATATAFKPTWLYLLYTYNTQADRGGVGLRPAAFGGFYDGGQSEIFYDWYPNISADNLNWDGIHIKSGSSNTSISASPMETFRYQWSAGRSPTQPSGGNQSGTVGAAVATSTGNDMPRPVVNAWANSPRTWHIGRRDPTTSQRGEVFVKNLGWWDFARTSNEMLALA